MLTKLTDIGFKKVGHWILENDTPKVKLFAEAESANILYCFVVDGEPKYIGKTVQKLKKRMYGYFKPGPTQHTKQ
jgi:hypothetical protein